ncbi:MAG: GntR family transcriptional regulator [Planctomycetota bacterium]|jgi:DNA-binding transcriptional regulator YhcF (GntR family)
MLTVDPHSPIPLGEQVRRGLRRAIAEGELSPDDPLPSVRQLAADLGVNLNTVARAYRELEREGLVVTARGRGTVVAARRTHARLPRDDLRLRVRDLLADAKLAGYRKEEMRRLVVAEVERRM